MDVPEIHFPPVYLRELVVGESKFRFSCDTRLTEADLQRARTELKETDEGREVALRQLRDMLTDDKDFFYRTDDAYLLRYLRHRKFRCKEAYKHLRNLYTTRKEYPDLFRTPTHVESLINTRICVWLPYTDQEKNYVFIMKFGNWRPNEFGVRDLLPLSVLISDLATMNPHAQINGGIDIVDLAGAGLGHMAQVLKPSLLRLWMKVMLELYPWRINRVILYNCSALHYSTITTVRRFLKKKIADRIIILRSDLSELHEYVNPTILPKEYGGSLDDEECYTFLNKAILGNTRYLEYKHSFIGSKKP